MSDLDVALRLRLVNQLSREAEEAERDLKDIKKAAEQLGRTRGGDQLGRDLQKIGKDAERAKQDLRGITREADNVREALGRTGRSGLQGLKTDADGAARGVRDIGAAADVTSQKLRTIDTPGGLQKLKADAEAAERAINAIGGAADRASQRMRDVNGRPIAGGGGAGATSNGAGGLTPVVIPSPRDRRRLPYAQFGRDASTGLTDRSGLDAFVPLGAGAGYIAGAGVGAGLLGVGKSYKRFAGDDRETEYILMNMNVPEAESDGRRKQVRDIVANTRVPYKRGIEGLNALAATGLPVDDVMALLTPTLKTSLASGAEPADVAKAAFNMKTMMGITPDKMQEALDLMVAGGNTGLFEVPDMARHLPDILTYASQSGFKGMPGLQKVIALMQGAAQSTGGDNDAAATNLKNVFSKMRSEETEKNFKEYGVNLPKEYKVGRAAGKDDVQILYDAAMKASKGGNPDILARLFTDMQAFLGLQALIQQRDKINQTEKELSGSQGTVETQFNRVSNDPQSSLDALSNAADRAMVALGKLADRLGLTGEINNIATETESFVENPAQTFWRWLVGTEPMRIGKPKFIPDDYTAPAGRLPAQEAEAASMNELKRLKDSGELDILLSERRADAARTSMGGYNQALAAEGEKSKGIVQGIVESLRAMLNFTATPTIAPQLVPPAPSGPAPQKQSSLSPAGAPVKVTQNITAPNTVLAARRAQREQNRRVMMAQAGALHDLGSRA